MKIILKKKRKKIALLQVCLDFLEGRDQCCVFLLESGGQKKWEYLKKLNFWLVKGHVLRRIDEKSEILLIFQ